MRAPSFFVAHGAPSLALEQDDFTRAARAFGESLRDVRAIALVSAHWQARVPRVNAVAHPEPVYDFGGFAPALYSMRYDAPGDPELAREIASLLDAPLETQRGWDHGVWVPFLHLLPEARTPIVEIALPFDGDPMEIGRKLAPLRERGIAIAGSGGIVHNLRILDLANKNAQPLDWAAQFDGWIAERLASRDFDAIANYERAPGAKLAVPTPEHFEPLLVALGAAHPDDRLQTIYEGFQYATLSMRSIALS
ncbi:MAG TPA: class III extradiol ring-cleavage dioxygenase [Thermoanaerobaculia bacterium]|nr:class III extradiol ring-cleavage dioxygenase [Thermoanaerobaculia bacterium]